MATSKPSSPESIRRARLLVIAAAILWSSSGLFAKAAWFQDWPEEVRGNALTFWRAVFAALAVLPFVRKISFRPAMIPMSLAFTAMTYSFLLAMVGGSETTTIWLQYVGPAWVAIAGVFGLGDRPTKRDTGLVVLSLIGISIIVGLESQFGGHTASRWPIALALFSGVTYAVVVLSIRHLRGVDVAWIGLVNYVVSAACMAPLVIGKVPWPSGYQWLALFAFGALQLAWPYMIFAYAVREIQSNEASLLTLIEPMAVPVWTFMVWRHHEAYRFPDWWTLLGAAFIASGFVWRYAISRRVSGAAD